MLRSYAVPCLIAASALTYSFYATPMPTAAALRTAHAASKVSLVGRHAIVGGGTSGIGEGIALRLAALGVHVHILGRDETRGAQVVAHMRELSPQGSFAFSSVDAFSLPHLAAFAKGYMQRQSSLDILVLSQGMATLQGFTPTADGLDQKLTLHFYGRMALAQALLPALSKGEQPTVLSVLSAGVHSGVADWEADPTLKATYSIKRAADCAGFYNDLFLDELSRRNEGITFVHAAPGFVATRWGTEMPFAVRMLVRGLQVFGKAPLDCAEFMLHPLFTWRAGLRLIGETGQPAQLTPQHTDAARAALWKHTQEVLAPALAKL